MKYLTFFALLLVSYSSIRACDCYDYYSFCEELDVSIVNYSKIVCYVEYTGNNFPFLPDRTQCGMFEVKIVDLFYGEIHPGAGDFLNSDSTFWVVSGADSCDDFFIFNEGDHALMATSVYYNGRYTFFDCSHDLFIYPDPLTPAEYDDITEEINTCLNVHCEEDLIIPAVWWNTNIYQGLTISSDAEIDVNDIVYKAKDRVTLNFRVEVGTICN